MLTMSRRIAAVLLVALFLPLLTTAQPRPTHSTVTEIDCFGLRDYQNDVYYGIEPDLSRTELAIVNAAWDGEIAWRTMTRTELVLARDFYREWDRDLQRVRPNEIPAGMEEGHVILAKNIELVAVALDAYLRNDTDTLNATYDEMRDLQDAWYAFSLEGHRQCAQHWTRAFGEPVDPHPAATPDATP